jgi:hypothetical protein
MKSLGEREGMAEKGKRSHLVFGGKGGGKRIRRRKSPSFSIEHGGDDRLYWRSLTRNRREAGSCSAHPRITQER